MFHRQYGICHFHEKSSKRMEHRQFTAPLISVNWGKYHFSIELLDEMRNGSRTRMLCGADNRLTATRYQFHNQSKSSIQRRSSFSVEYEWIIHCKLLFYRSSNYEKYTVHRQKLKRLVTWKRRSVLTDKRKRLRWFIQITILLWHIKIHNQELRSYNLFAIIHHFISTLYSQHIHHINSFAIIYSL